MYQPLIKFHPYPAIITQVLTIFVYYRIAFATINLKNQRICLFSKNFGNLPSRAT